MTLTGLGLLLSLAVDVAIAARLGIGVAADVLFVAIGFPRFLDTVVRAALRSSLVPYTLERQSALDGHGFSRLVSGLLNTALLTGTVVAAVVWLSAEVLAGWLGPGLDAEGRQRVATLLRLAAPFICLAPLATCLEAFINSQKRFVVAALRTSLIPGAVLVFAACGWTSARIDAWVLVGYGAGMGLTVTLFWLVALRGGLGVGYRPWALLPRAEGRQLLAAVGAPTIGFSGRQVSRLVARALASLGGPGGAAAFSLAFRLFSSVQTVLGVSVSTTVLPELSEDSLGGRRAELAARLRRNFVRVAGAGVLVAVVIALGRDVIIETLFRRGEFGEEAVSRTAGLLGVLAIGIPFSCSVPVLYSAFYAQRHLRRIAITMLGVAAADILMAFGLQSRLGLPGVAWAASLSVVLAVVALVVQLELLGVRLLRKTVIQGGRQPSEDQSNGGQSNERQ